MNIRTIVTNTLTENGLGSYVTSAAPVITALENAKNDLIESIEEVAADYGVAAGPILERLGLVEPVEEVAVPAATDPSSAALAETLSRIENTLSGLASFARQHGYRG